jgi:hypothetical protein
MILKKVTNEWYQTCPIQIKMNEQKWYHSNCKNVLSHTKMAGHDKNDRTNSRTICQQNRIAFSCSTASIKALWHGLHTCIRWDFSEPLQIWEASVVVTV